MLKVIGFRDKYEIIHLDISNYLQMCEWEDVCMLTLKLRIPTLLEPLQSVKVDFVSVVDVELGTKKRVIVGIEDKIFTYIVTRNI